MNKYSTKWYNLVSSMKTVRWFKRIQGSDMNITSVGITAKFNLIVKAAHGAMLNRIANAILKDTEEMLGRINSFSIRSDDKNE